MIPIYEQGDGRGIGHSLESFLERVDEICKEHANQGRARAFAIIFRDARDEDLKRILKDQGAFARLDRLSGDRLSVFFIHTASNKAVKKFNKMISAHMGLVNPQLPAIAFFRTAVGENASAGLTDVEVISLDNANLIHGLHELYTHIERYIKDMDTPKNVNIGLQRKALGAGRFVSLEALRAAIREGIGLLF